MLLHLWIYECGLRITLVRLWFRSARKGVTRPKSVVLADPAPATGRSGR